MTTNTSRDSATRSPRAWARALWVVAALGAVSYAGDGRGWLRFAAAQEPSPQLDAPSKPGDVPTAEPAVEANPASDDKKSELKSLRKGPKEDLEKLLARRGTLVVRDATLADWLFAIMQTWGVDIHFNTSQLQQFSYSGQFTDTPLEEVLNTILADNGFGYRKRANGLTILPQEQIGEVSVQQKQEIIQLEHSNAADVEPTLKILLSPGGKTQTLPSVNAIQVIDLPENIEQIRTHIERVDRMAQERLERQQKAEAQQRRAEEQANPAQSESDIGDSADGTPTVEQTITTVYRPKYVSAVDIQPAVQSQLLEGTATAVEAENVLVVMASESAVRSALQLMKDLDVPRRQVRISVLMYDVSLETLEQLGVNWRHAGKGRLGANGVPGSLFDVHSAPLQMGSGATSTSTSTTTGSTSSSTSTASSTPLGGLLTSATPALVGGAVNLYHVGRHFDVSAVLQALHQNDGARLLASPSVFVYDGEQSEIQIITEIPVQQLTQTDGGGSIGTTTFREAGILLHVLPDIADENSVRLHVVPEFSALQGFQAGQPIIDRRRTATSVHMLNGDTLVLAGLRRRQEIETVSGIPGLMNIKYLGNLFRSHRTNVVETELIIFMQAEIVDTDCEGLLREQFAWQVANETLDQIPVASHKPFIPPCNDPYCPYHNPPARPNQPHYHPSEATSNGTPLYGEPLPPIQKSPTPVSPTHDEPTQSPSPVQEPTADEETAITPLGVDEAGPPPVLIDETARRGTNGRMAMYRLPRITPEPALPAQNNSPAMAQTQQPPTTLRVATRTRATTTHSKVVHPVQPRAATSSKPATTTEKKTWYGEWFR